MWSVMLHSAKANICDSCVALCYELLAEEGLFHLSDSLSLSAREKTSRLPSFQKPAEIKKFWISMSSVREKARVTLSVTVYNHYKRIFMAKDTSMEIQKSNVLLLGPTGVGKLFWSDIKKL